MEISIDARNEAGVIGDLLSDFFVLFSVVLPVQRLGIKETDRSIQTQKFVAKSDYLTRLQNLNIY